jgi:aminoglycoside phosphotransferase (APT) family kinase protein
VLWQGRITGLLDWEWAGWGNPLLDLSWVFWTMRWRSVPETMWPVFLAGYGQLPDGEWSDTALRALALGQIAGILARVSERDDARQEWLRRARWTLDLKFPA